MMRVFAFFGIVTVFDVAYCGLCALVAWRSPLAGGDHSPPES